MSSRRHVPSPEGVLRVRNEVSRLRTHVQQLHRTYVQTADTPSGHRVCGNSRGHFGGKTHGGSRVSRCGANWGATRGAVKPEPHLTLPTMLLALQVHCPNAWMHLIHEDAARLASGPRRHIVTRGVGSVQPPALHFAHCIAKLVKSHFRQTCLELNSCFLNGEQTFCVDKQRWVCDGCPRPAFTEPK